MAVSRERELPHRSGETALRAELSKTSLGAAVDADADMEKLREAYVYGRVLELTHTIRLEKDNFYKGGVFQEAEAEAYVASITGKTLNGKTFSRIDVLKGKIRKAGGYPGVADKDLDTELLKAYKANAPEVVEAKEDPFYAPQLKAVMGSVRDALLKAKGGVDVITSLINIVVVSCAQSRGQSWPQMARRSVLQCVASRRRSSLRIGHVIYVSKAWLVWLIATNRRPRTDTSFRNFKKEKGKGKRDDYFKNDGIYSACNLKPEHQPIVDASEAYDENKHTYGEIMCGGAGTSGKMIVMFILFQKKYFVLMTRKQMVLVRGRVCFLSLNHLLSLGKPGHGGLPRLPRVDGLLYPVSECGTRCVRRRRVSGRAAPERRRQGRQRQSRAPREICRADEVGADDVGVRWVLRVVIGATRGDGRHPRGRAGRHREGGARRGFGGI